MASVFRKLSDCIKDGELELVKSKLSALPLEIRSSWKEGYDLICFSIKCGYLDAAKLLINLGLQLRNWEKNNNILNLAVRYGNLEIIKLLEEKSISIVSYHECGYDPFYCLAYRINFGPEAERILEYFFSKGLDATIAYDNIYTLLHLAAEEGNHQLISVILRRNPQLNLKHKNGLSPLHLAAMHGHSETVSLLLSVQHGLQYSLKDEDGRTPLLLAAVKGDIRTVSILLQRTMNAYKKNKNKMENISPKEGILLLYSASMVGDKKIFEMLRKMNININEYLPETGKTLLHIATDANQEQIVQLLLQNGADVNAKQKKIEQEMDSIFPTFEGYTPLHIAVDQQNVRLVKCFLFFKANVTACDIYDQNPLHVAARNGCLEIVKELLNSDCNINSMFTKSKVKGWTPLHAAVVKGHLEIVELFMKKGVNPNTMTDNLLTPLLIVAHTGNEEMAQLLLSYNANPKKAGGTFRQEAISEAASMGNLGVVKLLYDICSTESTKVKYDYFGLYNSAYIGHVEVVQFYLEKGANPNALANPIFLPPLYAAAAQGHDKIVEILLNAGAKCDLITNSTSGPSLRTRTKKMKLIEHFSSPLLVATRRGYENIVKMLLKNGAEPQRRFLPHPVNSSSEANRQMYILGSHHKKDIEDDHQKITYTPLHFAVESGNISIVEMLIEYKASVYCTTQNEVTPLGIAIEDNNRPIVDILLKAGASLYSPCYGNLFPHSAAVEFNFLEMVKYLLKKGAPLESQAKNQEPMLQTAINADANEEMIRFLISRCEANVNGKSDNGLPFLHYWLRHKVKKEEVSYIGFKEERERKLNKTFELLLEYGADPNVYSELFKRSILHYAVFRGEAIAVELLIDHGADINALDLRGETLFMFALKRYKAMESFFNESVHLDEELYEYLSEIFVDNPTAKNDRVATKYIIDLMTKEFARLDAANKEILEENRACLDHWFVWDSYNNYRIEIQKMRRTKIDNTVSYFDILMADEKQLESYVREFDADKMKNISSLLKSFEFPNYKRILRKRLNQGIERMKLTEKNLEFFVNTFLKIPEEITISMKVRRRICSFLTLIDLRNFLTAWKFDDLEISRNKESGYLSDDDMSAKNKVKNAAPAPQKKGEEDEDERDDKKEDKGHDKKQDKGNNEKEDKGNNEKENKGNNKKDEGNDEDDDEDEDEDEDDDNDDDDDEEEEDDCLDLLEDFTEENEEDSEDEDTCSIEGENAAEDTKEDLNKEGDTDEEEVADMDAKVKEFLRRRLA